MKIADLLQPDQHLIFALVIALNICISFSRDNNNTLNDNKLVIGLCVVVNLLTYQQQSKGAGKN
jgi:hypothetical protein